MRAFGFRWRRPARPSAWRALVPLIALSAGLLFATSAETSHGTELRGRRLQLAELVGEAERRADSQDRAVRSLRRQVEDETRAEAARDARIADAQRQADAERAQAGLTAVRGPGLTVSLDDAPRGQDGALPAGAGPDDVVVHQQDVEAVVNGLWAGGAEAMTIMGQRVIATSAVRCVGNTLLLDGRVYSPPFVITALGDPDRLRRAVEGEPDVVVYRQYVAAYGLGYKVTTERDVRMPAYDRSLTLSHAHGGQR